MDEPIPTVIAPATVVAPQSVTQPTTVAPGTVVKSPTTTEEQDRGTAGQRSINLIWEDSQSKIALRVVTVSLVVSGTTVLVALLPGIPESVRALAGNALIFLSNISSLVVGFYFGRTNHQRIGGVGPHDAGR